MTRISKYVSYNEAVKSQTATRLGIPNKPGVKELAAMKLVASQVFDKVREFVDGPLFVSSFFRSIDLNAAIGGSYTSQHCKGEAIDIDADVYNSNDFKNSDIYQYIRNHLEFDQLIWEFGNDYEPDWIHVSYKGSGNRKQILRAVKENGKVVYKKWGS
ncbi:MAG: hypothetical protein HWE07_09170 [Cytophagia bacterium]|nr:hypothetical protein [Cytophagia bacterium]